MSWSISINSATTKDQKVPSQDKGLNNQTTKDLITLNDQNEREQTQRNPTGGEQSKSNNHLLEQKTNGYKGSTT